MKYMEITAVNQVIKIQKKKKKKWCKSGYYTGCKSKITRWVWGCKTTMRKNSMKLNSSFFMFSVNCWQTAAFLMRHFCRLTRSKAVESLYYAFIWPLFSKPSWLEDAAQHRGWEGEKPRKSVPHGRGEAILSRQRPGLWQIQEGGKTVKTSVWDRESEAKHNRKVKEVRRIYNNPIEKDIL